jgi:hypothetical protein
MGYMEAANNFVRPQGSQSASVVHLRNEGSGWPYAISAEGPFKCLNCEAFASDHIVCEECRDAISILRAGPHTEALLRFLTILSERPGLLTALESLTDEAIQEYFLDRIRQHREP